MSKILNALKAAQKGIVATPKNQTLAEKSQVSVISTQASRFNYSVAVALFLILIFLGILVLNINLVLAFRVNATEINNTLSKVKDIEEIVNQSLGVMESFSVGMRKLDAKIASTNSKIEQNSAAIEDLANVNSSLSKRLKAVETELGKFQSPNAPTR